MKFLAALFIASAAFATVTPPAKWQNPTVWRNIKTGQTPDAARRILGDPSDTESTKALDIWYYADSPTTDENGRITRPKYGLLMFRKTPQGIGLQKWTPPDWPNRPTWDQLQIDYKQALADQRAATIAEKERIAAEVTEQRATQRQATIQKRQQTAEQAKIDRLNRRSTTVNRQPRKIPPAKPDAHAQLMSRYFITIGGAFIVIAIIIGGTYGYKQFNS